MITPARVRGSVEAPAAGEQVAADRVRISGWAFDTHGPLDRALVVIGGLAPVRVALGRWRPDVATAYSEVPHAGASGFVIDVDLRGSGPGHLPVALLVRSTDGDWHQPAAGTVVVPPPGPARPVRRGAAAFTIVQDEPTMLPLWLRYYGEHFAAEDLYVLDHDSTDASTRGLEGRCHVVPVHRGQSFDHRWLRGTVEAFQAFLLRSYETVVFAEVDEFIVCDPQRYKGLADYIERMDAPTARCTGFNVVQQPDEPPLDFSAPVLAQRGHWHASAQYAKRLISRIPLTWSEGFHEEYAAPDTAPDPALMLVHLHRVDYERCLARHRASAGRNWSAEDIRRGDGWHNRIAADAEFDQWFYRGGLDAPGERIPDHLRSLL